MIINYLVRGNVYGRCVVAAMSGGRRSHHQKMKREKETKYCERNLSNILPLISTLLSRYETGEVFAFSSLFSPSNFPCQTFRPIDCLNGHRAAEDVDEKFPVHISTDRLRRVPLWHIEKKGKFFRSAHCECAILKNKISSARILLIELWKKFTS